MSESFYHVDRRDELAAGETIELQAIDESSPDGDGGIESLYPEGLSNHGRYYSTLDLYDDDSDALWDVSIELLFELVRTAQFPERPSRFQSVFAFRALRDAERFVEKYVDPPFTVWRVTADESFTADMRLVHAEDYAHGAERARTYWRGSTHLERPLWEELLVPPVDVVETVEEQP